MKKAIWPPLALVVILLTLPIQGVPSDGGFERVLCGEEYNGSFFAELHYSTEGGFPPFIHPAVSMVHEAGFRCNEDYCMVNTDCDLHALPDGDYTVTTEVVVNDDGSRTRLVHYYFIGYWIIYCDSCPPA